MKVLPKWLIEKIELYQEIGFFDKFPESSEAIASEIIHTSQNSYFGNILDLEDDELIDQIILSYDVNKVWFIEDFMVLGSKKEYQDNYYLKVFEQLESISAGRFQPKEIKIKECGYCEGRDRRLLIEFRLDNKQYNLNFCIDLDVLVLSFLVELNEIIEKTRYSFQTFTHPYGNQFVLFLSTQTSRLMSEKLNWNFDSFPTTYYWSDRAWFAKKMGNNEEAFNYYKRIPKDSFQLVIVSEYVELLISVDEIEEAKKVYRTEIKRLKNIENPSDIEKWWTDFFIHQQDKLIED